MSVVLTPRPGILDITPYVGGKSTLAGEASAIKLSSNESALGPSPRAIEAYKAMSTDLHRYPDGAATALRDALGALHGLAPERIVCGSGSDEIIDLLARAYAGPGDEVLYSAHGFLMYALAARGVGATPVAAPERNLTADVDALLAQVSARTRIVFLANPNNPTGTYVAADAVKRLRAELPDRVLLVLDAAYAEFVERPDYDAGVALVDGGENVVMTRTFSKIYSLAGLRLGWAYCPPSVVAVLNRLRGPFNVNTAAQVAGLAALGDRDHLERARRHNEHWLVRLSKRLEQCGLAVTPSVGNFVLVRFAAEPGRDAKTADGFLQKRGIIVRNVDNYGLPDCLRITIGLDHEMAAVGEALEEFTDDTKER